MVLRKQTLHLNVLPNSGIITIVQSLIHGEESLIENDLVDRLGGQQAETSASLVTASRIYNVN